MSSSCETEKAAQSNSCAAEKSAPSSSLDAAKTQFEAEKKDVQKSLDEATEKLKAAEASKDAQKGSGAAGSGSKTAPESDPKPTAEKDSKTKPQTTLPTSEMEKVLYATMCNYNGKIFSLAGENGKERFWKIVCNKIPAGRPATNRGIKPSFPINALREFMDDDGTTALLYYPNQVLVTYSGSASPGWVAWATLHTIIQVTSA